MKRKTRCAVGGFRLSRIGKTERMTTKVYCKRTNLVDLVGDVELVVKYRLSKKDGIVAVRQGVVAVGLCIKPSLNRCHLFRQLLNAFSRDEASIGNRGVRESVVGGDKLTITTGDSLKRQVELWSRKNVFTADSYAHIGGADAVVFKEIHANTTPFLCAKAPAVAIISFVSSVISSLE